MGYRLAGDRLLGHDWPGVHGTGFAQYELDELELGGRAAMALDDPDQAWWEINGRWITEVLARV